LGYRGFDARYVLVIFMIVGLDETSIQTSARCAVLAIE
jgi:hypothetical protein